MQFSKWLFILPYTLMFIYYGIILYWYIKGKRSTQFTIVLNDANRDLVIIALYLLIFCFFSYFYWSSFFSSEQFNPLLLVSLVIGLFNLISTFSKRYMFSDKGFYVKDAFYRDIKYIEWSSVKEWKWLEHKQNVLAVYTKTGYVGIKVKENLRANIESIFSKYCNVAVENLI